jgi:hypothetical protein
MFSVRLQFCCFDVLGLFSYVEVGVIVVLLLKNQDLPKAQGLN